MGKKKTKSEADVSPETISDQTPDTELDAPAEEAAAASDARLEELLADAPSAPPAPPPLVRRTVALTCELREGESPNYAQTSLDVSLDGRQSQTLRRYADCCLADGARLADGRVVDDCGTAVRHLLERIAEAEAGGPAAA